MKWIITIAALIVVLADQSARATDHVLLVAGLGGEQLYSEAFVKNLERVRTALVQKHGYSAKNVRLLGESVAGVTVDVAATLEAVRAEFERLAAATSERDTLLVILMGHGQSDYEEPKFNLQGPDLDAAALHELVQTVPVSDVRLILSFPCSGQFSEILRGTEYSIIASTDGPRQLFLCAMNAFVPAALEDTWCDSDGDGAVSFYEVYQYLSTHVDDFYKAQPFLQTENTSLEDNGDGKVTTASEGMDAGDGELSQKRRIGPAPGATQLTSREAK